MRKLLILLVVLSSCAKEEIIPIQEPAPKKNYNISSYELQQSNITIDLQELRRKNGFIEIYSILAVAYLDINGDNHDDIFITCSNGNNERVRSELYVWKNDDYYLDNSYLNEVPSFIHPRKAIVGDYNKDGRPDIFIAAHGYDRPPFPGEYNQMLLSNNGKYDLKKFEDKVGFYHSTTSADIDNDGDLDIFALDNRTPYFLINDGKGNFTYSITQINADDINAQYSCELIDVNKDGYVDLIMGGHEFDYGNTTRIYWGNSTYRFVDKSDIPSVDRYGVVLDIDQYDLDGDGINELIINRAGGRSTNEYFYQGWFIQVVKLEGKNLIDVTNQFIENNSIDVNYPKWIVWLRFQDYDDDGKVDLFSMVNGGHEFVRWELENKKLKRIN